MKSFILLCSAAVLVPVATPAMAQDAAPSSPKVADGEIIVTATRNETLASKTPIALTAMSGDDLLKSGVTDPTNLAEDVPNLSIDRGNGLQITIRGITSSDGTEKGDPSAAFMLDGIYIARPQAQEVSFFDVNRVEVLRGPQGTLFGRNTTAGLINVISNHPTDRLEGSLDASYGSYNATNITGVLNVPVNDAIAVRGAVNYDRRDNYYKAGEALTSDIDPYKNNVAGRLSASFDMGPAQLLIVGDYSKIKGKTLGSVPVSNLYSDYSDAGVNPTYDPIGDNSAVRTSNIPYSDNLNRDNESWGVMADFSYDFGPLQLNYLGSHREFDRREELFTGRDDASAAYRSNANAQFKQDSHELRFSTTGSGPLSLQFGGYYFKESGFMKYYIYGLLSPDEGTPGYVFGFPQRDVQSESYAAFSQATYAIIPELRLTAGVRYSHDKKSRLGATVICGSVACDGEGDSQTVNDASRSFSKVTWRAGLDYDLDDRTLLYATVSTGYKAGGFNDGCEEGTGSGCTLTADALYYNPETLTSYEAGVKTRLLDNMLRLNLTAFHYDFKGIQLSQLSEICGGPCQVTTNAGQAKVDGVELETTLTPASNTKVNFSASWLNARYTDFKPNPDVSWAGYKLDRSPDWTLTGGITQGFDLDNGGKIELGVTTRFVDHYTIAALGTLNQFEQPSYTKTDLQVTYNAPNDVYYVQGFVRNLEDSLIVTGAGSSTYGTVVLADPRTYGVRAGVRF
ncbi:TonB-dependent receptor [Altericroceibacterium indicum]|uniref:TonB-dependent receptor n=1 Tax=Altericroceibacterium indicum TaxID=374177 RepID=UPI0031B5A4BF